MGLWFTEGFSWTTNRVDFLNKWDEYGGISNPSASGGRFHGGHYPFSSASYWIKKSSPDPGTTNALIVGFAYAHTDASSTDNVILFKDGATTVFEIECRSDGKMYGMRGATEVFASTSAMTADGTWYYWEVKVLFSDTVGQVSFQLNGAAAGTSSADKDTYDGTAGSITAITLIGGKTGAKLDDVYMGDTSGSFDFLGDVTIETLYPTGLGTDQDFTGYTETTNTYLNVDDTTPDDDSSYNYSNTSTHQDLFTFDSITASGSDTIHGVGLNIVASKADAGATDMKGLCKSSSTEDTSSDLGFDSVGYKSGYALWDEDPNTSAAWTIANLNSAEFGYRRN
jgi:hypothetical protein